MPRSSEQERVRRRHLLLDLLQRRIAGTQDDIVERLRREGFAVTQATVSRDLEDLGAVRIREGNRHIYVLPGRNGPPIGIGSKLLPELVLDAASSGNLVVVRTFPGMAPTVAAVIDSSGVDGVLGTIQGDDTVLVVAAEGVPGKTLAKRIRELSS